MTHLIRRIAQALCVAGGLGVATINLAAAQQPASFAITEEQARHEAMKVEVGLLGDQTTMRLPLTVALDSEGVIVKGHVPSESARQRVLQVARQSCYLPVTDALTVPMQPNADPLVLKKSARDMLVRQLGSKADRFTITATEDGQLKVEGDVANVEEKLAASRCLRGVLGCSRVVNCLSIRGGQAAGAPITVVSSDGDSVVCKSLQYAAGQQHKPELALQRTQYVDDTYPPLPRTRTAVLPSGLPQVQPIGVTGVPAPTANCNCSKGTTQYQEAKPTVLEKLSAWRTSRVVRRQQPGVIHEYAAPQAAQATNGQPVRQARPGQPRLIEAVPVSHPRTTTNEPPAAPELPRQTGDSRAWPPAYRPAHAQETFQSRPIGTVRIHSQVPTAQPVAQVQPMAMTPAVNAPAVLQASSSPELRRSSFVPASVNAAPVAADQPSGPPPIRMTEKDLQKRLDDACGKLAKEVRIEVGADRRVIVHVYALPATEHMLVARLLHVTELGARNVELHVHLAN